MDQPQEVSKSFPKKKSSKYPFLSSFFPLSLNLSLKTNATHLTQEENFKFFFKNDGKLS